MNARWPEEEIIFKIRTKTGEYMNRNKELKAQLEALKNVSYSDDDTEEMSLYLNFNI